MRFIKNRQEKSFLSSFCLAKKIYFSWGLSRLLVSCLSPYVLITIQSENQIHKVYRTLFVRSDIRVILIFALQSFRDFPLGINSNIRS